MSDLLRRADGLGRARWTDLPDVPGIYVVYWTTDTSPEFMDDAGKAMFATPTNSPHLRMKWDKIQSAIPTDIIYFGKADNIRRRVRLLIRFGVGKANNHQGGEWIWQIREIASAEVLVQSCPSGKQLAFENWLLYTFYADHNDYPLANRKGPEGSARWRP